MEQDTYVRTEVQRNWDHARQAAFFETLLSVVTGRSVNLLSFDKVKAQLRLTHMNYRGLHEIPLGSIRGSVGRYQDFTGTFLPRASVQRDRWKRVDATAYTHGFPPIETYQVGEAYFVLDGNHRVSVARQMGAEVIQAHVWEYTTAAGLSAQADLDELLIKAEYAEFLTRTGLGQDYPDIQIECTVPGRYRELEYQITLYQSALERIDEEPVTYQEAASAWYEMIYLPSITIIRERGVMERFPDRTEADLFSWVWRHHKELQRSGRSSLAEAADEVAESSFTKRLMQRISALFKK